MRASCVPRSSGAPRNSVTTFGAVGSRRVSDEVIYGSLFSGAGGFDLGLDAAGMTCAFQCEIDKQARAVLRYHWPEVPKHEDVRELSGRTLPRIDLLVGGFPCQDVSVAGNRAGLAGKRTGLFYEFTRLVSELAPEWILLENVPGLLSSGGGRDMGAVLWTLGELGYGWAYRSLDAQYFGVPQRRERLFIVGRAGGRSPVEVLFEPESVPGNPPPRREAREDVAGCLGGQPSGGGWRNDTDRMTFVPDVARCLVADGERQDGESETFVVAAPLTTRPYADKVSDETRLVAYTLRAAGFDAGEDGTGRGTPLVACTLSASKGGVSSGMHPVVAVGFNARQDPDAWEERSGPLDTDGSTQAVAFHENQRAEVIETDTAGSLKNGGGKPGQGYAAVRQGMGVRRLTPTECERLMAWPDLWTLHGVTDDGKAVTMADGPRYRMCGNGVVSSVAEWIGKRLAVAA